MEVEERRKGVNVGEENSYQKTSRVKGIREAPEHLKLRTFPIQPVEWVDLGTFKSHPGNNDISRRSQKYSVVVECPCSPIHTIMYIFHYLKRKILVTIQPKTYGHPWLLFVGRLRYGNGCNGGNCIDPLPLLE